MNKTSETPRDLRKKLSRSTASRDLQKDKLRVIQYELKINRNCLLAMTTSRDNWRIKAENNKKDIETLKQELSQVTQSNKELIIKLNNIDCERLKKTSS